MRKFLNVLLVFLFVVLFCGTALAVPDTSLGGNKKIIEGKTLNLIATLTEINPDEYDKIVWESDDTSIATVTNNGTLLATVTAKGKKADKTNISVKLFKADQPVTGGDDTIEVEIFAQPTITITKGAKQSVIESERLSLTAEIKNDEASFYDKKDWRSSNPAIVSVANSNNLTIDVEAKGEIGEEATITVSLMKDGETLPVASHSITVTIVTPAPKITSKNNTTVVFGLGGTFEVTATHDTSITPVYSLSNAPNGVGIHAGNGTITINAALLKGVYPFVITVRDNTSIYPDDTQNFTLTVSEFVEAKSIDNVPKTAKVGDRLKLTGTVNPATASFKEIVWEITDSDGTNADLETIDEETYLFDTRTTGDVKIKAKIVKGGVANADFTQEFTIKVENVPVTDIIDIPTVAAVGVDLELTGKVVPEDATNDEITWVLITAGMTGATSDDIKLKKLKTITASGTIIVEARVVDGNADGSTYTKPITITVNSFVAVTDITNLPSNAKVGTPLELTGTVVPANASMNKIIWEVIDLAGTSGATLSGDKTLVTTKPGTISLTATINDGAVDPGNDANRVPYVKPFSITIEEVAVTGVTLDRTHAMIKVGSELQLKETVLPTTASDKGVEWGSSKIAVATVANGLVKGVTEGIAVITVSTDDGEFAATCEVQVFGDPQDIPGNDIVPKQTELPAGTPSSVGGSDIIAVTPTIFGADNTRLAEEAEFIASMLKGINPEDLAANEHGVITIDPAVAEVIAEDLLKVPHVNVITLPVLNTKVTKAGDMAAITYELKGSKLMVNGLISKPENVRLLKVLTSNSGAWYKYTDKPADLNDKMFTIQKMDNTIFTGNLVSDDSYKLLFLIKDNGDFDLNDQETVIWDPMALVGVPVTSIALPMNTLTLALGGTEDLGKFTIIEPLLADNIALTWTSSATAIASVTASGVVKGETYGTAVIKATAADGSGVYDECTVYVSVPVTGVELSLNVLSIVNGETQQLTATVKPVEALNKKVTWSTSDAAVADVDADGNVEAISVGTAKITVTTDEGNFTDECDVTVTSTGKILVDEIKITPNTASIVVDKTVDLTVEVLPANATDKNVDWTTSNSAVATVDTYGKVTGVSGGNATITATAVDGSGVFASCAVTVTVPVRGVTVSPKQITVEIDSTRASQVLVATITPSDATNKNLKWSSSNPTVVTVTGTANTATVRAISVGEATITVTTEDGGYSDICTVIVMIPKPLDVDPTFPSDKADVAGKTGIDSGNLEVSGNKVYLKKSFAEKLASDLFGVKVNQTEILPVFEGVVSPDGEVAKISFTVTGKQLLVTNPEDISLIGLISGNAGEFFDFVSKSGDFEDGKFTLLYKGTIFTGKINPNETYELVVFIKDGGMFDLDNSENGKLISSIFLASEKKGGRSGGGCSAGYGYLAFALLGIPLFLRRR
jgi:uncharacterized protein YjdB